MSVCRGDGSNNLAVLDIMRGAPSIYMLYLGYDEVAHHSGPWTDDAFGDLQRLDRTFARLKRVVEEKAPRPYDLIILSDHGQSFGATFKQRYNLTVKELIEQNLPAGTTVTQAIGGDTGANGLSSVANELANVQASGSGTAFDNALAKQGQKLATKGADLSDLSEQPQESSVTAYGSGNALVIEEVNKVARYLAQGITNCINFVNPDLIVIGDEYALLGDPFLDVIRAGVEQSVLPSVFSSVRIELSTLTEDTVLKGAFLDVFSQIYLGSERELQHSLANETS